MNGQYEEQYEQYESYEQQQQQQQQLFEQHRIQEEEEEIYQQQQHFEQVPTLVYLFISFSWIKSLASAKIVPIL